MIELVSQSLSLEMVIRKHHANFHDFVIIREILSKQYYSLSSHFEKRDKYIYFTNLLIFLNSLALDTVVSNI